MVLGGAVDLDRHVDQPERYGAFPDGSHGSSEHHSCAGGEGFWPAVRNASGSDGRELVLTNLDKVMYPETGTTKADVLAYYAAVAPVLIPAAAQPAGHAQALGPRRRDRGAPGRDVLPEEPRPFDARAGCPVPPSPTRTGPSTIPLVNDPATLTWLAQIAALEIHVPQWRVDSHGNAHAAGPAGAGPGPGRGRGPGGVRGGGQAGPHHPAGRGPGPRAGDERQQGHPPLRGPGRDPELGPDLRLRPRTGPRAGGRPPGSRRQRHEEDPAHGQGAGGLEPEQRRQDHHRAVLAARPAPAHGGRPADLAGAQLRVPAPAGLPGGDEAGGSRQGSVRPGLRRRGTRAGAPADTRRTTGRTHRAQRTRPKSPEPAGDGGDADPRLEKYRTKRDRAATPEPVHRGPAPGRRRTAGHAGRSS